MSDYQYWHAYWHFTCRQQFQQNLSNLQNKAIFFVRAAIMFLYFQETARKLAEMYQDYIDGKKELREINMEFNARYVKDDDMPGRRSCVMQ